MNKKGFIFIVVLVLILGVGFLMRPKSEPPAAPEPVYETTTESGLDVKAYYGVDTHDAALVMTAFDEYTDLDYELSSIKRETWARLEYSDGVNIIQFYGMKVNGIKNVGGELFYKKVDDELYFLYFQVSNNEYLNNGINLADYDF